MKQSPQNKKLTEMLSSSKLVAGGFLGNDTRDIDEIIGSDIAQLASTNYTIQQLADRMQNITDAAVKALGNWTTIDESRQAKVDEAKGILVCPWPHPGRFAKRVTTLKLTKTNKTIQWSDLNIHLIAQHSFFEGKGSHFRLEPKTLAGFLF